MPSNISFLSQPFRNVLWEVCVWSCMHHYRTYHSSPFRWVLQIQHIQNNCFFQPNNFFISFLPQNLLHHLQMVGVNEKIALLQVEQLWWQIRLTIHPIHLDHNKQPLLLLLQFLPVSNQKVMQNGSAPHVYHRIHLVTSLLLILLLHFLIR